MTRPPTSPLPPSGPHGATSPGAGCAEPETKPHVENEMSNSVLTGLSGVPVWHSIGTECGLSGLLLNGLVLRWGSFRYHVLGNERATLALADPNHYSRYVWSLPTPCLGSHLKPRRPAPRTRLSGWPWELLPRPQKHTSCCLEIVNAFSLSGTRARAVYKWSARSHRVLQVIKQCQPALPTHRRPCRGQVETRPCLTELR